jgi:hypothetical protein
LIEDDFRKAVINIDFVKKINEKRDNKLLPSEELSLFFDDIF